MRPAGVGFLEQHTNRVLRRPRAALRGKHRDRQSKRVLSGVCAKPGVDIKELSCPQAFRQVGVTFFLCHLFRRDPGVILRGGIRAVLQ